MRNTEYWIKNLSLLPHPEGGYYKEVYRAGETINSNVLPTRFTGDRVFSTSIYFLLVEGNFSAFHRIKSDEIWHFHDGYPINIYVIGNNGRLEIHTLGIQPHKGHFPQITIPANLWFASESTGKYSLAGCSVSPGFDFCDFELADRDTLLNLYGEHRSVIEQFTRPNIVN